MILITGATGNIGREGEGCCSRTAKPCLWYPQSSHRRATEQRLGGERRPLAPADTELGAARRRCSLDHSAALGDTTAPVATVELLGWRPPRE